jgi:hypothetical protein
MLLVFDSTQITHRLNFSSPQPNDPCHPLAAGQHPPTIIVIPPEMEMILFRAEGRAKYRQSTTAAPSRASQAKTGDTDLLITTEMDMKEVLPIDTRNATRTTEPSEMNRQGLGVGDVGDPAPTLSTIESFAPAVAVVEGESSASAALVKDLAPPADNGDSRTSGQDCSMKQYEFAEMLGQITASGRTSQVPLAAMTAKTLRKYCDALPTSGTVRLIRPSTPSGSGSPNVVVECFSSQSVMESPKEPIYSTLADVLESQPDKRYNLSAKGGKGIINRAKARGRELPPLLKAALELLIANSSEDTGPKT